VNFGFLADKMGIYESQKHYFEHAYRSGKHGNRFDILEVEEKREGFHVFYHVLMQKYPAPVSSLV